MSTATQYLTLGLGPEIFGIDIGHVREILDMREMAALPMAPAFLVGMIDVRGDGIPVVDLRLKLGLARAEPTPSTRIVILDVPVNGHRTAVGFIADRVVEVATLDGDTLAPPPEVGGHWHSRCLAGIGRKGQAFVIVLDIDTLMAADDTAIEQTLAAAA